MTKETKRVTVYDIAKELGISPSTVSRVLNNSSLISEERSSQILETAQRLGYEKRMIRKHVSRAILNIHLFLPRTDSSMIHFFYNIAELIEAIQMGFGEVRLNIITRVNDGNIDFLSRKKTGSVDGCIFAFTTPPQELKSVLEERKIPYILLNREVSDMNWVSYDMAEGMNTLVQESLKVRKEGMKACYIAYEGLKTLSKERFLGIKDSLAEQGITLSDDDCYMTNSLKVGSKDVITWIKDKGYNMAFCFNDFVAISLLQAAPYQGIKIPEDLGLIGVDSTPIQNLLDRRINTLTVSPAQLGTLAGEWLKDVIINRDETSCQKVLPATYIKGDTL